MMRIRLPLLRRTDRWVLTGASCYRRITKWHGLYLAALKTAMVSNRLISLQVCGIWSSENLRTPGESLCPSSSFPTSVRHRCLRSLETLEASPTYRKRPENYPSRRTRETLRPRISAPVLTSTLLLSDTFALIHAAREWILQWKDAETRHTDG